MTEILIAIGRSVVPAVLIFVGINVALGLFDISGNVAWAIVHWFLASVGIVFLRQILLVRRRHRVRDARPGQNLEKYRKAASAQ